MAALSLVAAVEASYYLGLSATSFSNFHFLEFQPWLYAVFRQVLVSISLSSDIGLIFRWEVLVRAK